jgi:hypothetical protein
MRTNPQRGRIYRRRACRGTDGKQLGARCPQLATSGKHSTWTFAVDMPSLTGKRTTMRRSGFTTKTHAQAAQVTMSHDPLENYLDRVHDILDAAC